MSYRRLDIRLLATIAVGVLMIAAFACGGAEAPAAPQAPAAARAAAPAAAAAPAPAAAVVAAPGAPQRPQAGAAAAPAAAPVAAAAGAAAPAAKAEVERTMATERAGTTGLLSPTGTVKGGYVAKIQVPGEIFIGALYDGPMPTSWQENPRFTAAVQSGDPWDATTEHWGNHAGPLERFSDRIPIEADRAIWDVYDDIGDYGGIWRLALSGWMLDMAQYSYAKCTNSLQTNVGTFPYTCKELRVSDDGREHFHVMRQGMKWSDGTPLDIESVKFAHNGINTNPEKNPRAPAWIQDDVTGEWVTFNVIDDKTWSYEWTNPKWGYGETGTQGQYCRGWCLFASEYHKTLVPGFADPATLDAMIRELDLEDWVSHFKTRLSVHTLHSKHVPQLGPYVQQAGTSTGGGLKAEANPFFHVFDPMGNQLPYHDGFQAFGYESREVAVFRAMAGENDALTVSFVVEELPLYQQNMEKGDFSIYQWPSVGGADMTWTMNQTYNEDPEIGRMMRQRDFRIAWSVAHDREGLNETSFLGIGTPQNGVVHPSTLYYPGDQYPTLDATFEPDRARALLDGLGYMDTDGDGFRNRIGDLTGDTGNIQLYVEVPVGGHAQDRYLTPIRLVQEQLADVGIDLDWKASERYYVDVRENTAYFIFSGGWGGGNPFSARGSAGGTALYSGNYVGPIIGEWYHTKGESGMGPTGPDPDYLPLAPTGTFPADSTGNLMKLHDLWFEAAAFPIRHPTRISKGKEFMALTATEKLVTGLIGFTGNQWGVMIKRNNFRNVPKHHTGATIGFRHATYFFEDGRDNLSNPGNRSKLYTSESFLTGLTYD